MPVEKPPAFTRGTIDKPPLVADDEIASEEWDKVVPELLRLDIVKPQDAPALANYVLQWSAYNRCHRAWQAAGFPMTGRTAQGESVHPLIRSMAELSGRLIRAAEQFGLTPAAEARLGDWSTRGQNAPTGKGADDGSNPFASAG